jgi:hypothetical protein
MEGDHITRGHEGSAETDSSRLLKSLVQTATNIAALQGEVGVPPPYDY